VRWEEAVLPQRGEMQKLVEKIEKILFTNSKVRTAGGVLISNFSSWRPGGCRCDRAPCV